MGPGLACAHRCDAAAYPDIGGGVAGVVELHCALERDGRLTSCKTLYSLPSDRAFDTAGLKLSHFFRMAIEPAQLKVRSAMGANVIMRIAAPFGEEAKQKRIVAPTWLTSPNATALAAIFPAQAAAKGVTTGLGLADCTVNADGSLTGCQPAAGDPPDLGFSEAAVKAATSMKMSPWTDNGGPVDGASVRIPVRFAEPAK